MKVSTIQNFLIRFVLVVSILLFDCYGISLQAFAQKMGPLNATNPQVMGEVTHPVLLRSMTIYPEDPMRFDFVLESDHSLSDQSNMQLESERLIRYFFTALTIPEGDLWVNLSPFESDRVIPHILSATELGQDLLEEDYYLKDRTAWMIDPRQEFGEDFWNTVHERAYAHYGTIDLNFDVYHKVWIVPGKISVFEEDATVTILNSELKVMMEKDYLALQNKFGHKNWSDRADLPLSSQEKYASPHDLVEDVFREIIIPAIEHEVNQGHKFSKLRQIFHSLILAQWYKDTIRESTLSRSYVDQRKVSGLDSEDPGQIMKTYQNYVELFESGNFNFIQEVYDPETNMLIPQKYFSGGITPLEGLTMTKSQEGGLMTASRKSFHHSVVAGKINSNSTDNFMAPDSKKKKKIINILAIDKIGSGGQGPIDEVEAYVKEQLGDRAKDAVVNIVHHYHEDGSGLGDDMEKLKKVLEENNITFILLRDSRSKMFNNKGIHKGFMEFAYQQGLRGLIRMGVGTAEIDDKEADRLGIFVARTDGNAKSVAELTLFLMAAASQLQRGIEKRKLQEKGGETEDSATDPESGGDMTLVDPVNDNDFWKPNLSETTTEEYIHLIMSKGKYERLTPEQLARYRFLAAAFIGNNLTMGKELAIHRLFAGNSFESGLQHKLGLYGFGPIAQIVLEKLYLWEVTHNNKKPNEISFQPFVHAREVFEKYLSGKESGGYREFWEKAIKNMHATAVHDRADLIANSDILSLHMPGDEIFRLTMKEIKKSKAKIIINTARAELMPLDVLEVFLSRGGIYVGDLTMTPELLTLMEKYPGQVLITPHLGGLTQVASDGVTENTKLTLVDSIERVLGLESSNTFQSNIRGTLRPEDIQLPDNFMHADATSIDDGSLGGIDMNVIDIQKHGTVPRSNFISNDSPNDAQDHFQGLSLKTFQFFEISN